MKKILLKWIVILQPVSFIVIDKRNRGKDREIEERDIQRDGNFILVFSSLSNSRASQALGTCALLTSLWITLTEKVVLKVSKSRKQNMLSQILPKNERWGIFQYIKMPQRSFFGRI